MEEIIRFALYIIVSLILLFIGPIYMSIAPYSGTSGGELEKQDYIYNIFIASLLQIFAILVLLEGWKIIDIF